MKLKSHFADPQETTLFGVFKTSGVTVMGITL
jgi:hypothetical protein